MQWSKLTAEKQMNQLTQTEFGYMQAIIIIMVVAITCCPSPLHQRCTAAKDGILQGGHSEQRNAVESVYCKRINRYKQSFAS
jgi:hypothetical protein